MISGQRNEQPYLHPQRDSRGAGEIPKNSPKRTVPPEANSPRVGGELANCESRHRFMRWEAY